MQQDSACRKCQQQGIILLAMPCATQQGFASHTWSRCEYWKADRPPGGHIYAGARLAILHSLLQKRHAAQGCMSWAACSLAAATAQSGSLLARCRGGLHKHIRNESSVTQMMCVRVCRSLSEDRITLSYKVHTLSSEAQDGVKLALHGMQLSHVLLPFTHPVR